MFFRYVLIMLFIFLVIPSESFPEEKDINSSRYCIGCHNGELIMTFRNGEKQSIAVDKDILAKSVHGKLICSDCHSAFVSEKHPKNTFNSKRDYSIKMAESCRRCHFDKYTRTLEGIHYYLMSRGNLKAPVCTDCHGAHSVYSGRKEKIVNARKCEQCHPEVYKVYTQSVHGGALILEHNEDVPICSDCHRAHAMTDPRTTDFRNAVPQICGTCHADNEIMKKYGLSTAVVDSYLQDFHGITLSFYKREGKSPGPIAVCTDCHGIHDITKVKAPNSNVVKANLVKRCQKCHKSASTEFPDSWISHYNPGFKRTPLLYTINLGYKVIIVLIIIGFIFQIALHVWYCAVSASEAKGEIKELRKPENEYIKRFGAYRITEHWINAAVFAVLVLTGLSQKFYGYAISQWIVMVLGGIDITRIIHRYSGIIFAGLAMAHIISTLYGILILRWQPSMIIRRKDFRDLINTIKYYSGITKHPAECDRYNYMQKFEYWSVLIGGLLMIATGFALWFPAFVTGLLPGEIIPVAKVLHSNQAFFAFLVITLLHIYNSMVSPLVFPVDTVIFTGRISKERMMREHPLEYERLFGSSLKKPAYEDMTKK